MVGAWALAAPTSDEVGVEGGALRRRLGAQTMARFLAVMPVAGERSETRLRWVIRYLSVLEMGKWECLSDSM